MQTFIHNKDVFTVTEADSLVLPVDGSGPNLVGNLAQQFMKRIGVDRPAAGGEMRRRERAAGADGPT